MNPTIGRRTMKTDILPALLASLLASCGTNGDAPQKIQAGRAFETSFESAADFGAFYIVPQGGYDSGQELTSELRLQGEYSHKAWIERKRADNNDGLVYMPHRAYPTIQLHKTQEGGYATPCLVSFWAYLDIALQDRPSGQIDDWFSFATLSPDRSDNWSRTILANITPDGYLRLVHVPNQGEQQHLYQANAANDEGGDLLYPYRQWVKIDIYIDLSSSGGYAKLWQNGRLVSHAAVKGGHGILEQAHFGLYASAALDSGRVYNDQLSIREVADEAAALESVGQR